MRNVRSALGTLSRRRRRAAGVAALGGLLLLGAPALAGATGLTFPNVGSVTATINVQPPPVRSVTVSTATGSNSLTYGACTDASGNSTGNQLTLPTGSCALPAVTVTNGSLAGTMLVEGAAATPADGGTQWQPCEDPNSTGSSPGGALMCDGPTYFSGLDTHPGQDQFQEVTNNPGDGNGVDLLTEAQCDLQFDPSSVSTTGLVPATCTAGPGQSATENIQLTGPSASTDPSSTFTTTVTWIASS